MECVDFQVVTARRSTPSFSRKTIYLETRVERIVEVLFSPTDGTLLPKMRRGGRQQTQSVRGRCLEIRLLLLALEL
jgi:hypothetical protein